MTMRKLLACALVWLLCLGPVMALSPDEILPDAKLEQRARGLSAQLRCLVCQNQSIDDSDASLAKDLRKIVRERLLAGDSDDQIMHYFVARYGDFVLLKPPLRLDTALLWATPGLAILLGGVAIALASRRRGAVSPIMPLTEAERARLAAMLDRDPV